MRKLLFFLIVLAGLLVIVDRVAVAGVERDLANRIAAANNLKQSPSVSIEGIPFLTQAVSGKYEEVRFDLGTLTYAGVPIKDLRGAAYNVTAPLMDVIQNRANIVAGTIAITGTITNQTIDRFAPQGIKVAADGDRLTASGELPIGAQRFKFNAQMRLELVEGGTGIRVIAEKLDVENLPKVPDALASMVTYTISFKGKLPFDVKVTKLKPVPGGLELSAEASNVPLRG
ncbi:DUF2993 domain-containing protein [Nonomuraea sp. NPDC050663]|uniref:DUF2993 domain-containing protein n=1 Tax=Nonomuraea sp. NPDC050663 TaxID=3364370 RepID=UPI0037895453